MSWQALNWCAGLHKVRGPCRAVLWAMANRHNAKTGLVTMGLTSLADESGLSRSAAHRHLTTLECEGFVLALIPGAGTRATAYTLPRLASHSDGTQAPVDNPVRAAASVPSVTGSSDLASHSGELASHSGGTKPKSNQKEQPTRAGATVAADPTADAVGGHSASGNGIPPDARAALAAFKATLKPRSTETEPKAEPS